jgi:hypothetical protein
MGAHQLKDGRFVAEKAAELSINCDSDETITKRCFEFVRDSIKHSRDYRLYPVTCKASECKKGSSICPSAMEGG